MQRRKPPPKRARVRRGNAEDALRLRGELLDAAFDLFNRHGLDGVTMRAVATSVGVSPMTPYRYFSDKAALLRGLWERVLLDLHETLAHATASASAPVTRKRAQIEALLAYWEGHPEEFRLVYQTQGESQRAPSEDDVPIPVYAALLDLMRRTTEDLAREWKLDVDNVKLADDMVFATALGYLQAAMVNRRHPWSPLPLLRTAMVDQMLLGMRHCLAGTSPAAKKVR